MKRVVGTLAALSMLGGSALCAAESKAKSSSAPPGQTAEAESHAEAPRPDATTRLFLALDEDGDGTVTREEMWRVVTRSVAKRVQVRFSQLDRNGDGKVTRDEVNKMDAARFARFDLNRDGAFTAPELTQVLQLQTLQRLEQLFARLDVDGDGRCSFEELQTERREMLASREATARRKLASAGSSTRESGKAAP
jgi:Ca2+-binding EF-hand superfamily protein